LIEIVSLDEQDRADARERFRFYRDRGYEIRTHDLSKTKE
jgi:DNA polymerase-3 subunit chi